MGKDHRRGTSRTSHRGASERVGKDGVLMTHGNDRAFSHTAIDGFGDQPEYGLSKREYFAAMAMQGIVSMLSYPDSPSIAELATRHADALIAALNAPICPDCKLSNADNHYDAENQICPTYERARSEQE